MTPLRVSNIFSLTTKRVTDLVLEQSRQAFWQTGIALDAKMTSIITLLHQSGPMTSTELGEETGLSRQLVESRLRRLVKDRYLNERRDTSDLRRRVYAIREEKLDDVTRALAMVADFERVYEALWAELGVDLHRGLRELEKRLEAKPLVTRVAESKQAASDNSARGKRHE